MRKTLILLVTALLHINGFAQCHIKGMVTYNTTSPVRVGTGSIVYLIDSQYLSKDVNIGNLTATPYYEEPNKAISDMCNIRLNEHSLQTTVNGVGEYSFSCKPGKYLVMAVAASYEFVLPYASNVSLSDNETKDISFSFNINK